MNLRKKPKTNPKAVAKRLAKRAAWDERLAQHMDGLAEMVLEDPALMPSFRGTAARVLRWEQQRYGLIWL